MPNTPPNLKTGACEEADHVRTERVSNLQVVGEEDVVKVCRMQHFITLGKTGARACNIRVRVMRYNDLLCAPVTPFP